MKGKGRAREGKKKIERILINSTDAERTTKDNKERT